MRLFALVFFGLWADLVFSQSLERNFLLSKASAFFSAHNYESTINELNEIEAGFKGKIDQQMSGLLHYWRGLCFGRLQNFPQAIQSFNAAIKNGYLPEDIHYELGQALYASEQYPQAREQFKRSFKNKFKQAVSLYYMAYISKELGDRKTAFRLFRAIRKLPQEEIKDVLQAAEMQVGDLYFERSEERKNVQDLIVTFVIPQYQLALDLDEDSALAPVLREKIKSLQRRYDLVLFQLRNGRPAAYPPYFIWFSQEFGSDSNVTFSPLETTISKARQASTYSRSDFIGRYTFYLEDYLSFSPEFRFNYTHYFNRVPEVYRNDNYLIAPSVRTAYEHTLWGKPAAVLFDYDFAEARRDVDAKQSLDFSVRSHSLMLGQRFNYFKLGESILRLRYRMNDSYINGADSTITSFIFEQIAPLSVHTLILFGSYDRMRVRESIFDTNAFSFRTDLIMASFRGWFTPIMGLGLTLTDPYNNREDRGYEMLLSPSLRLSRTFWRCWRANLKYDYMRNISKDKRDFAFSKTITAFELEYLF
jgi:hypothetical protein